MKIDQKAIDLAKGPLAKAKALLSQLEGEGISWNVGGFVLTIRLDISGEDLDIRLTLFDRVLFDEQLTLQMVESVAGSLLAMVLHTQSPVLGTAFDNVSKALSLVTGQSSRTETSEVEEADKAATTAAAVQLAKEEGEKRLADMNKVAALAVEEAAKHDPEAEARALAAARKLVADADAAAASDKAAGAPTVVPN